jgi:hypothetical protein
MSDRDRDRGGERESGRKKKRGRGSCRKGVRRREKRCGRER